MTSDDEVTTGELGRRLGDVTLELREMRTELRETYVRKDVYISDQAVRDVERDNAAKGVAELDQRLALAATAANNARRLVIGALLGLLAQLVTGGALLLLGQLH